MADTEADALVDYTAERGIAFIPYGPLGANPMQPGANLPALEALAWLLRRSPNIIAIPGTTKKAHLEENMPADAAEQPLAVRFLAHLQDFRHAR